MSFEKDPVVNVIDRGIKRDIRILLENQAWRGALVLTYAGMDVMAFLAMPANHTEVSAGDFMSWAGRYVRLDGDEEVTAKELYAARCGMLHTYGPESRLTRAKGVRQIAYMDRSDEAVRSDPSVPGFVLLSVPALAEAFFAGVDRFLVDAFSDPARAPLLEERFKGLFLVVPVDQEVPGT